MLAYPDCHVRAVHWLYQNSRAWLSSDVIVMSKWHHHVMSHLRIFKNFWEPFINIKSLLNGEQEKEPIIPVRMG